MLESGDHHYPLHELIRLLNGVLKVYNRVLKHLELLLESGNRRCPLHELEVLLLDGGLKVCNHVSAVSTSSWARSSCWRV
jgi:hypothetical protein